MEIIKAYKVLTRNDSGETNSHQSGITIPKEIANSKIFPTLGKDKLNPREELIFYDDESNMWSFQYIYYNDIYFGKDKKHGHDEHRLTCVKQYFKKNNIISGDTICFSIDSRGVRHISFEKNGKTLNENSDVIKLGNGWRYIAI